MIKKIASFWIAVFCFFLPVGLLANPVLKQSVDKIQNYEFGEAQTLLTQGDIPEPIRAFYLLNTKYMEMKINGHYKKANAFLDEEIEKTKPLFEASLHEASSETRMLLMYYGALLGLKAQVYMAESKYLQGYYYGYRGVQKVKSAYESDSTLTDALLAIGTYEFYSGIMAQHYHAVGLIVNTEKAIQKGIDCFRQVWEKGDLSKAEAGFLLLLINTYEIKNYDEAIHVGKRLVMDYPGNLENRALTIEALLLSHHFEEAENLLAEYDRYTTWLSNQGKKVWMLRKTYLEGVYAMEKEDYTLAKTLLKEVINTYCFEFQWQKNRAYLMLGQMADLEGDHKTAQQYYQQIIDSKETTRAVLDAKNYIKNPYTR
ncbi:MAG: hypothetical protein PHE86_03960 [Candidatus Marinimicrobia bacterium]|nr:hypothetical protein [Candidatus Neomarinimicrobiota bacterium]